MVYGPEEDSFLLQKFVKQYANGLVLDIGTGSGIQAKSAADKAQLVVALDIDNEVIKYCSKNVKEKNVFVFKSDLFEVFKDNFFYWDKADKKLNVYDKAKVHDKDRRKVLVDKQIKFDLIIFNPPYLPQELKEKDLATEGGEKGYEVLERFFDKALIYLKDEGKILIVFSSFTDKHKVHEMIKKNNLKFVELERKHMFFEDLFVYEISRV